MKISQGILITILVISFATALQGAFAGEYGDIKYTGSGISEVFTPVIETSMSSGINGVGDIGSTSTSNRGVTGDEATNIINNVNGMIRTIMIASIVIILIIFALIYYFLKRRRRF